jgi:hypothetical protein
VKLPTPNKTIQQFGNLLIDRYGFTFVGLDSREHLEFQAPNGKPYKLSSTPKGSFSTKLELPQALKLAGLEPESNGFDATRAKNRAEKTRADAKAAAERHDMDFAAAVAAADRAAYQKRLSKAVERRRGELNSIHRLMGGRGPLPF